MNKQVTINIDSSLIDDVLSILAGIGIEIDSVISILFKRIIREGHIFFLPNNVSKKRDV